MGLALVGQAIRPWHNGVVTWTYTNPLAVAFVGGMWVAELWLRGRLKSRGLGVALIALGLTVYGLQTATHTAYASLSIYVWVLASTSALAGLLCIEGSGVRLDWPAMRALADWTYAIYLCHQVVRLGCEALLPPVGWLQFVGLVGGSTLAGKLGYDLVELPVNRWLRRMTRCGRPPSPTASPTPTSRTPSSRGCRPPTASRSSWSSG